MNPYKVNAIAVGMTKVQFNGIQADIVELRELKQLPAYEYGRRTANKISMDFDIKIEEAYGVLDFVEKSDKMSEVVAGYIHSLKTIKLQEVIELATRLEQLKYKLKKEPVSARRILEVRSEVSLELYGIPTPFNITPEQLGIGPIYLRYADVLQNGTLIQSKTLSKTAVKEMQNSIEVQYGQILKRLFEDK